MTKFDQQRAAAHVALDKLLDEIRRTRFSGDSTIIFHSTNGGIHRTRVQWIVGTGDACLQVVMDNFLKIRKKAVAVVRRKRENLMEERG